MQPASNPYQTPSSDPALAIRSALDDSLRTASEVEFETVVTRADLRTALSAPTFRRDLVKLRQTRLFIMIPVALCALAMWWITGVVTISIVILLLLLAILMLLSTLMYGWTRGKFIKLNRHALGPIRGTIDRDWVRMERQSQTVIRPLSQLVGAARFKDQIVLCFDTTHSLFDTLPLRGFPDPDTAQLLGDNLAHARPFADAQPYDPRRLQPIADQQKFTPGEAPVFFSGLVLTDDLRGTPLARAQRSVKIRIVAKLLVTFSILVGLLIYSGAPAAMTLTFVALFGAMLARVLFRVIYSPLVGQADESVMFRSTGWIDSEGLVTLTATGQSKSSWAAFDLLEINDHAISIRTRDGSLWNLIARRQFDDVAAWQQACAAVIANVTLE